MRKPLPTAVELKKLPPDGGPDYNRLVFEKSPYLLQHAGNPIDWFPWGDAAFEKARKEDKPVFLSIGYSTCHWCHVMERESFEDDEVADFMNRHFVSIKVDREEREDIDKVYMSVCTAMTGSGGWPLTIVMTPDRKPFFAGTYFPKSGRFGRPGLMELLGRIADLWKDERPKLLESADKIAEVMSSEEEAPHVSLDESTLKEAYQQFRSRFDWVHGGFGQAPKFPSPHNLSFLLRSREKDALSMVEQTLQAMRLGGIFDHIGFGFHRYSTDRIWLLPHFEKMLYDQAMLTLAYVETFQATRKPEYARTAREVITYVLRDMTSPEGGFYSAEDADSEGEEGKFYTWRKNEFDPRFADVFGFEDGGNFEDQATGETPGTNIPYLKKPLDDPRWEEARQKLFEIREKRIHPHKDDKILAGWNGLMIAALAKAAAALNEPAYAQAASKAAEFVLANLRRPDGRLLRRYRQGEAAVPAFSDDYAFLAWGLLELYQATFELKHLDAAAQLTDQMTALFWDSEKGGYFFEGGDSEKLFMRKKDWDDGAIPSGNSVAMLNLLRLGAITGRSEYSERAEQLLKAASASIAQLPMAYAQFLIAVDFAVGPTREIVIAGKRGAADTQALIRAVHDRFLPRAVVVLRPEGEDHARLPEYARSQGMKNGRATGYVCENFACRLPATDVESFSARLG